MSKLRENIEIIRTKVQDLRFPLEIEDSHFLQEVVFHLDECGKFIKLNDTWIELSGYEVPYSLHTTIFSYLEDQEQAKQIKNFIFGNEQQKLTIELKIKTENSFKWVTASLLKPGKHKNNKLIWGTFMDITKWKEEQTVLLRHLSDETEQQVKIIKLLKEFLHDINSAHAGILSSIELLEIISSKTNVSNRNKSKYYTDIKAQVLNISNLLDNFLVSMQI